MLDLDDPAGPPGSTVRHLLAHASGLPFEGDLPIAGPGERRIYSNAGFDLLGELLAARAEMPFAAYVQEAVLDPLGLGGTELKARPSEGLHGPLADLAAFGRELLAPTLVAPETLAEATEVAFLASWACCPAWGGRTPNDWGAGIRAQGRQAAALDRLAQLTADLRPLRRGRDVPLGRPRSRRRLRVPDEPRVRRLGARGLAAVRGRGPRRARGLARRPDDAVVHVFRAGGHRGRGQSPRGARDRSPGCRTPPAPVSIPPRTRATLSSGSSSSPEASSCRSSSRASFVSVSPGGPPARRPARARKRSPPRASRLGRPRVVRVLVTRPALGVLPRSGARAAPPALPRSARAAQEWTCPDPTRAPSGSATSGVRPWAWPRALAWPRMRVSSTRRVRLGSTRHDLRETRQGSDPGRGRLGRRRE